MKIKQYLVVATSLFLLTACAEVEEPIQVDVVNPQEPTTEVEIDQRTQDLLTMQDLLNEIVSSGEVEGCAELEMDQFKESCEANILANRAKDAGNADACDEASTDLIKQRCEAIAGY